MKEIILLAAIALGLSTSAVAQLPEYKIVAEVNGTQAEGQPTLKDGDVCRYRLVQSDGTTVKLPSGAACEWSLEMKDWKEQTYTIPIEETGTETAFTIAPDAFEEFGRVDFFFMTTTDSVPGGHSTQEGRVCCHLRQGEETVRTTCPFYLDVLPTLGEVRVTDCEIRTDENTGKTWYCPKLEVYVQDFTTAFVVMPWMGNDMIVHAIEAGDEIPARCEAPSEDKFQRYGVVSFNQYGSVWSKYTPLPEWVTSIAPPQQAESVRLELGDGGRCVLTSGQRLSVVAIIGTNGQTYLCATDVERAETTLPPGIYVLHATDREGKEYVQKFIVNH